MVTSVCGNQICLPCAFVGWSLKALEIDCSMDIGGQTLLEGVVR